MRDPLLDQAGFALIGVHVGCPNPKDVSGDLAYLLPGILLSRIVWRALERNGLAMQNDDAGFMGTIFDGMITVRARQPLEAIKVLKSELKAVHLLKNCQLGYLRDDSMEITGWQWDCVYPSPDVNLNYLLNRERHELAQSKQLDSLKRLGT